MIIIIMIINIKFCPHTSFLLLQLSPTEVRGGAGVLPSFSHPIPRGSNAPWTGHRFDTGNTPFIHTHITKGILESPIHLMCMCMNCGRQPACSEKQIWFISVYCKMLQAIKARLIGNPPGGEREELWESFVQSWLVPVYKGMVQCEVAWQPQNCILIS